MGRGRRKAGGEENCLGRSELVAAASTAKAGRKREQTEGLGRKKGEEGRCCGLCRSLWEEAGRRNGRKGRMGMGRWRSSWEIVEDSRVLESFHILCQFPPSWDCSCLTG